MVDDVATPAAMYDDGRCELPMGEQIEGFTRYTADGDMVCHIARAGRAKFGKGGKGGQ